MSIRTRSSLVALSLLLTLFASAAVSAAIPSDAYAGSRFVINADELNELLGDPNLRIFDTQHIDHYRAGHIPGANHLDVNRLIDVERFDFEFAGIDNAVEVFSDLGIGPEHTVVLYWGNRADATYTFWILDHLGHADVRVLNGGIDAWRAAGYETVSGTSPRYPSATFVADVQEQRFASIEWVQEHLNDPDYVFGEARNLATFQRSRLPGTNVIHAPQAVFYTEELSLLVSPEEMARIIEESGLLQAPNIVTYCGRGRASSQLYWALRVAGIENIRNFEASMVGWTAHNLPIASGR